MERSQADGGRGGRGTKIGRREFTLACAAGSALVWVEGCGYYAPEQGVAYAPWNFPTASYPDPKLALVHAAILAASPHNTQPWRFRLSEGAISLFADRTRRLGAMDPIERELMVGLGCALENLLIAARKRGFAPRLALLPDAQDPTHVARIELAQGTPRAEPLYAAIASRRTHRGAYADLPLPARTLAELAGACADEPQLRLHWLTARDVRERFASMTLNATRAIVGDRVMSMASYRWYRHSQAEIEAHRDGLTLDAQAVGPLIAVVGKLMSRPSRETADGYWIANTRDQHCKHASAFGVLSTGALRDPAQQLRVGRAYQRLHLLATLRGLAMQPLNQAAERRDRELELGQAATFGGELAALVGSDRHAQMLFRIGRPRTAAHHSPRRGMSQVI